MSNTPGDRYLEYLQRLIPELITRSTKIKFAANDRFDLCSVMLYASIVELSNGACRLISVGEPTGVATLVRMALEALVDLTNLSNDKNYVNYLDLRLLEEWSLTYTLAENGNPFLAGIAQMPDFQEAKNANVANMKALREAGYRRLNAKERFKRAKMSDVYDGMYRWLSSDSHSSMRALTQRHLEIKDENTAELHILREPNPNDNLKEVDALCGFLISASELIHLKFGSGVEVVADLKEERTAVQAAMQ